MMWKESPDRTTVEMLVQLDPSYVYAGSMPHYFTHVAKIYSVHIDGTLDDFF